MSGRLLLPSRSAPLIEAIMASMATHGLKTTAVVAKSELFSGTGSIPEPATLAVFVRIFSSIACLLSYFYGLCPMRICTPFIFIPATKRKPKMNSTKSQDRIASGPWSLKRRDSRGLTRHMVAGQIGQQNPHEDTLLGNVQRVHARNGRCSADWFRQRNVKGNFGGRS